jgi:methionyl aminopeptidase
MIPIKTKKEIEAMRESCALAAKVLIETAEQVKPGIMTKDLEQFAAERIKAYGAKSAFLGYRGYPNNICISVNEEVVHGLAGKRKLKFGDIVSLDVGVLYKGFIGDTAKTVPAGGCDIDVQKLLIVTEAALYEGIKQAVPGNKVKDISRAIQTTVEKNGFSVVREFVGHGVGRKLHEEPQIPNYVDDGDSPELKPGMTLAIEPMINMGKPDVVILKDCWTVVTKDGKPSAHFEHTVLVTENEPEILTCLNQTVL